MPVRQSFCFNTVVDPETLPLETLFREARAIGFEATEFHFRDGVPDWRAALDAARRHGLVVAGMCGHGTLTDGLNREANHDRIEAELRTSIEIAADNGIPGVICFTGNRNDGQSDAEGLIVAARGLRRVAPYAEEKGVNLNVELLNSRRDHPGYLCDRTAAGVTLCEMVGSERVKLLFDIYHMQIMEGDLIETIRRHIRHIGHFHTAGNPGRRLMLDDQELNYRGICKAIAETGYDLYVGHEFGVQGDPLDELRQAFALCDR